MTCNSELIILLLSSQLQSCKVAQPLPRSFWKRVAYQIAKEKRKKSGVISPEVDRPPDAAVKNNA